MPAESRTSAAGEAWASTSSGTSDDAQTTTSAAASRSTARRVSRSAAPGPAPANEITEAPAPAARSSWPGTTPDGRPPRPAGPLARRAGPSSSPMTAPSSRWCPASIAATTPIWAPPLYTTPAASGVGGRRLPGVTPAAAASSQDQHQVLGAVHHGRAGAGGQVLERHDPGHHLDRDRRAAGAAPRRRAARTCCTRWGRPASRTPPARRRPGGRRGRRPQPPGPRPGTRCDLHHERDPLDRHVGRQGTHDGLGPAHGLGRRAGRHDPVGVPQDLDRPPGHAARVAPARRPRPRGAGPGRWRAATGSSRRAMRT